MKLNFISTTRYTILLVFLLGGAITGYGHPSVAIPDGYATQGSGTTGGGRATPVTVTTASAFKSAVKSKDPAVIIVKGKLDVGNVGIGSNKTILGADPNSGLYGGSISAKGTNYIFQNLIIGPTTSDDAMELSGAKNVFIHKCEFIDGADGALDIVRKSDYITLSWCKFYYVKQTSHRDTLMIGNSDKRKDDAGKLRVTIHHTWFAEKCHSKQPFVRFGRVHLYNNYYSNSGNAYCIGIGIRSQIRLEYTHFEGINEAWTDMGGMNNRAQFGRKGVKFTNAKEPTFASNTFPVFDPPYSFTLDKVDDIKSLLTDKAFGAGNCLSR